MQDPDHKDWGPTEVLLAVTLSHVSAVVTRLQEATLLDQFQELEHVSG